MANQETEYYLIGIPLSLEGRNNRPFIREALEEKGLNPTFVNLIDPASLPAEALRPPEDEHFGSFFERILGKTEDKAFHPIIHALQQGGGQARISEVRKRGDGVLDKTIETALRVLQGHVIQDPENPDILICPYFQKQKDPLEEINE